MRNQQQLKEYFQKQTSLESEGISPEIADYIKISLMTIPVIVFVDSTFNIKWHKKLSKCGIKCQSSRN